MRNIKWDCDPGFYWACIDDDEVEVISWDGTWWWQAGSDVMLNLYEDENDPYYTKIELLSDRLEPPSKE